MSSLAPAPTPMSLRCAVVRLHRGSVLGGLDPEPRAREVGAVGGVPLADVVREAWQIPESRYVATIDGRAVKAGDAPLVQPGSVVDLWPRAGGGFDVFLAITAIVSTAASAYLASRLRVPIANSQSSEDQRRSFNPFSNETFEGDDIPIPFGELPRYGGKVIARVPMESADGSGADKLGLLIDLGEGPIQSIAGQTSDFDDVDGATLPGLYLQDQPSATYSGVRAFGRMGTEDQRPIRGFKDTTVVQPVGAGGSALRNTSGTDRTGGSASGEAITATTENAVHAFQVRVRLENGLFRVADNGQVGEALVSYRLRWRESGGSYGAWQAITLRQARQSPFWSSPIVEVGTTAIQVEVQVERVTAESGDVGVQDGLTWDSLVAITDAENNFGNRALLALVLTAGESLQNEPRVSVDILGYADLRIWDGVSISSPTFTRGYSNNACAIALEVLTNARWGMGRGGITDANVNFPSLLTEWPVSDEDVPVLNDLGEPVGTRKRYVCNGVVNARKPGPEWLATILDVADIRHVKIGDVYYFAGDRARPVTTQTFSDTDIAADDSGKPRVTYSVEYTKGGLVRKNQVVVQFDDAESNGKLGTVTFPRVGQLHLGGVSPEIPNTKTMRLWGVWPRAQAAARCIRELKKEYYIGKSLSFVSSESIPTVLPGERFGLGCRLMGHGVASGAIMEGSTDATVRLDQECTFQAGVTYEICVVHLNGDEERRELSLSGAGQVVPRGTSIEVTSTFTNAPDEGARYVVEAPSQSIAAKPWILQRLFIADNDPAQARLWGIEAIEYIEGVYDDTPTAVNVPGYSGLVTPLTPPGPLRALRVFERRNAITGTTEAHLAWSQYPADRANTQDFRVFWRATGTLAWVPLWQAIVAENTGVVNIVNINQGYDFVVVAVSSLGAALGPGDPRHPIARLALGLSLPPPPPPDNLDLDNSGNVYTLSWDPVDGAAGYIVTTGHVENSEVFSGVRRGFVLARTVETSITGLRLSSGEHYFAVRSVGVNGRMSTTPSLIDVDNTAAPSGMSSKSTHSCDIGGTGTLTNATSSSGDYYPTTPSSSASWLSPEYDTGSETLTQLTYRLRTGNRWEDATIGTIPYLKPSIEADQWGIDDEGPPKHEGMIFPPYPDDRHRYTVEVRTKTSGVYSGWSVLPPHALLERTFRQFQVRVTWERGAFPYRPALRELFVEAFH